MEKITRKSRADGPEAYLDVNDVRALLLLATGDFCSVSGLMKQIIGHDRPFPTEWSTGDRTFNVVGKVTALETRFDGYGRVVAKPYFWVCRSFKVNSKGLPPLYPWI